jgi:hypothetical protein
MSRVAERPAAASAHIRELGRLIDTERVGAGKLDQEQVVLNEVVTKRRLSERTVRQGVREGVFGVGTPLGGCRCLETLEETHDVSPGLLLNEWLWLATNSTSQTGWTLTLICQRASMPKSFIIRSLFLRNDLRLFQLAAKPTRNLAP